ncbi:DEKNAAC102041 [Brettanomyces naardenensis]|uniref:isoleucine--tRNA ligase n=1 Tax=Brettanomyces naardenensis TaxID=13370 RepID=A0A448YJK2_BRENA|nr:DEKNAAC102041 [Brettanomyces naardenensis]
MLATACRSLRSQPRRYLCLRQLISTRQFPSARQFSTLNPLLSDINFEDAEHKYSSTVILPKSDFGNRSNAKLIESTLKPQATSQLYEWNIKRDVKNNDLNNLFILHDGPPYANGDLHIGHALNKILKDIIIRFQLLEGKKVHYKPGWDCHGLPIELKTLEKLGKERKQEIKKLKKQLKEGADVKDELESLEHQRLSSLDIIRLSKQHALATQKVQSQSFQEMGIMGDFQHPYLTLHRSFVINQLKIFKKLFDHGLIHRQEKPVYWGCENATALAEGELEYNNKHESKTAYVKFPISKLGNKLSATLGSGQFPRLSALIWTSTPWTLASNKAICVNQRYKYTVLTSDEDGQLIVGTELKDSIKELKPELKETGIEFSGADLLDCTYTNPLLEEGSEFPFLHGSHVTNITGTALVHTAPGHGQDDYLVCLKNGIKPYSPVDHRGRYTSELPSTLADFIGLKVLGEGNDKMLERLKELQMCFARNDHYIHSYPYDWRSKKPIIIRATPQWFIDVSKIKEVTTKALQERVHFHPEKGSKRLISFINNRNEWCISRQRSWGVPIPVLYKKDTGEPFLNDEVIQKVTEVIEKEDIDSWFEENDDMSKWFPDNFTAGNPDDYVKGKDTMDVWFDSGSSWRVIEKYLEEEGLVEQAHHRGYLADIYLEGSDQHRGWFQSSLLTKVGSSDLDKKIVLPYRTIVTHGFTLDEKGEKMSKSLGNTVLPRDILNGNKQLKIPSLGIDGLRLWVAQSDYSSDVSVGPTVLKHVGENLKKIRFTFKFLLGNLNDFNASTDSVAYEELDNLDRYVLSETYNLERSCLQSYKAFNYSKIVKDVNHFVNSVLSSIYFDVRKDCLYTDHPKSLKRRATQTVLTEILRTLESVLCPILPIITQEVWNSSSGDVTQGLASPFMLQWHTVDNSFHRPDLEQDFKSLFSLRNRIKVLTDTAMRKDKNVRNSLETVVYVTVNDEQSDLYNLLKKYEQGMDDYLLVSKFVLNGDRIPTADYNYEDVSAEIDDLGNCKINVVKSDKLKCPRCWKFTRDEGDELCDRCNDVVDHL